MITKKKKIGLYTLAFILLFFVLLMFVPLIFKNQIKESLLNLAGRKLNAQLQIGDFEIGIFENFPNITFSGKNALLVGINGFVNDTLLEAKKISLAIDPKSLFKNNYDIREIKISEAYIETKLDSGGYFNWDILKVKPYKTDTTSHFKSSINNIEITNSTFKYINLQSNSVMTLSDINAKLFGERSKETTLNFRAESKELTYSSNGKSYISNIRIDIDTSIEADFENKTFQIINSSLYLNELQTILDGSISSIEGGYNFDLKMKTPKTDFYQVLSLIPTIYDKELKTSGSVDLEADFVGDCTDTNFPILNFSLQINDAMLQYPTRPQPIHDINLHLTLNGNPNSLANLSMAIERFNFQIGSDKIEGYFRVKPVDNNPNLEGKLKGRINLADIEEVLPLKKDININGDVDINLIISTNEEVITTSEQASTYPILAKLNAKGTLESKQLALRSNSTTKKLVTLLNMPKLDSMMTGNITIPLEITNETLFIKPFKFVINNDIEFNVEGYTKFDYSMDYKGNINLPPSTTNGIVSHIPFGIGGTLSNPQINVEIPISTSGIITSLFKKSSKETQNKTENN